MAQHHFKPQHPGSISTTLYPHHLIIQRTKSATISTSQVNVLITVIAIYAGHAGHVRHDFEMSGREFQHCQTFCPAVVNVEEMSSREMYIQIGCIHEFQMNTLIQIRQEASYLLDIR